MGDTKEVRIGNAGGYWGDDLGALERQLDGGPLDAIGIDFLAEITMSIMQKQKARNPKLGYAHDFVGQMQRVWPKAAARGCRIITNAGGVNPAGLAEALAAVARAGSIKARVGVVSGDDLMGRLDELGPHLDNMETGEKFSTIRARVAAANAYFGAWPIVAALEEGADVVVTGRCTDTSLTMAPLIQRFGWGETDWDRLAGSVVAGHILECGAQSTGGNSTDWRTQPKLESVGYPVMIGAPDGSFVVTKHPGTGGRVDLATVSEQLVYEMGDPSGYITPDVTADFRTIELAPAGRDRVAVRGVKGRPPPPTWKVSIAYADGYKCTGSIIVCGPDAVAKARAFARIFWKRLPFDFAATHTELVGFDACHGPMAPRHEPNEVLLRLSVRDPDEDKCEEFGRMLPSLILSGPPGVAITGGRPKPTEILAYWPALVPRDKLALKVEVFDTAGGPGKVRPVTMPPAPGPGLAGPAPKPALPAVPTGRTVKAPLAAIAYGRSGDKGDTANVGIVARSPEAYAWLRKFLTAARVKKWFGPICRGKVVRHEVPNLRALNFLLEESLDGGGTRSLRLDAQGKTYAPAVLAQVVEIPAKLLGAGRGKGASPARGKKSR